MTPATPLIPATPAISDVILEETPVVAKPTPEPAAPASGGSDWDLSSFDDKTGSGDTSAAAEASAGTPVEPEAFDAASPLDLSPKGPAIDLDAAAADLAGASDEPEVAATSDLEVGLGEVETEVETDFDTDVDVEDDIEIADAGSVTPEVDLAEPELDLAEPEIDLAEPEIDLAEPEPETLPPLEMDSLTRPRDPKPEPEVASDEPKTPVPTPAAKPEAGAQASDGTTDEATLRAALSGASRELIEKIVWEVVPELAETIIREELERLIKARE